VPIILGYYDVEPLPAVVDDAIQFLQRRMVEQFETSLPLHAGGLELLDELRARGVATALVSSSWRALVNAALRVLGPRFDVTLAGDEVTHAKPHPEPYLTTCARLSVEPSRAVVLEDALSGVLSAEAAGCPVVAVPFVAPIDPGPGRWVVDALTDIEVDWLLGLPCS